MLSSQSAASYSSYILAISMMLRARDWSDVLSIRAFWLIAGTLCYLVASAFWSDPWTTRDATSVVTRALLVLFFVASVAECQLRQQMQRWLGKAMAIAGMVAVSAALFSHVAMPPLDGRLNGLGQLDTHVIAALVYGVVLLLSLHVVLTESSRRWQLLALTSSVFIVFAIYLSDSRNAWVSVGIGCMVLFLAHRVDDRNSFLAALSAVVLVFTVALATLLLDSQSRDAILPRGLSFRPEIWAAVIGRIAEDGLWFGRGIITEDAVFIAGIEFQHAHSMYLSVMHQGGLIGLSLFLAMTLWAARVLFRNYEFATAKLALSILALSSSAYLLDGHELIDKVGSTWFMYWFPIAIALGYAWSRPFHSRPIPD